MQNNTEAFLNANDDFISFDMLPSYITTVNNIIEYIEITTTNKYGNATTDDYFLSDTIRTVKALDPIHSYNDDLFDAKNNKVISIEDAKKLYSLKHLE